MERKRLLKKRIQFLKRCDGDTMVGVEMVYQMAFLYPPSLFPLMCNHFLLTQFSHQIILSTTPHLPFMKSKERKQNIVIVVVGLQMLPLTIVFSCPVPGRFDFYLFVQACPIVLTGCSFSEVEDFLENGLRGGSKGF